MQFWDILGIAAGLSMDAFAAALCQGLSMKRFLWGRALIVALLFGGFQALMPFIGWLLGSQFKDFIEPFDHWIAFALLALIGGKMLYDCLRAKGEDASSSDCGLKLGRLVVLAIATSIDALAVGVTFPTLLALPLPAALATIGCTTFALSLGGVFIGRLFGTSWQKLAEILGGAVLVLLGIKILIEGLI